MSILNAWVGPDRALVAVDTDVINGRGQHYGYSKILPLVHANTVLAARGDRRFLFDLYSRIYLGDCEIDYDVIIDGLPQALSSCFVEPRVQGLSLPYEFVVVGWSPKDGCIRGRWHQGNTASDDWKIRGLGDIVSPWESPEKPPLPNTVENIKEMAIQQTHFLKGAGTSGGGKLIIAELTRGGMTIRDMGDLG